jgi:hypothetical protein
LIAREELKLIPKRFAPLFNLHRRIHRRVRPGFHEELKREPRISQHAIPHRGKRVHQER